MEFRKKRKRGIQIDITPIVDTVFNLLIFFALSLNFIVTPGIELTLPRATAKKIIRDNKEIMIQITAQEDIIFNQQKVTLSELSLKLAGESFKKSDTLIIIQADEKVLHGKVVQILDLCRKFGLTRTAIATRFQEDE